MPVRWAVFHPDNNKQALLATELGVWETNHLHMDEVEWQPSGEGMPAVRVDMLKVRPSDNIVLASTHGRGFFTAEYPINTFATSTPGSLKNTVSIYPNPTSSILNISNARSFERITVRNMNGQKVWSSRLEGNTNLVNIQEAGIKRGQYLIIIEGKNKTHSEKVIIL